VLNPPAAPETSVPPAGKGLMRLHLFEDGRTLRPAGLDDLSLVFFKLEFFSAAGVHAPLTVGTLADFSGDIELEAGSWTISLSGYSDTQGTALEAQGQAAVEIAAGRTTNAVIKLEPAGTGVFDYAALRSSLGGKSLTRAALALTSLRDNSVQTVDLLDDAGGGTLILENGGAVRGNLRYSSTLYGGGIEVNGPGVCILNGGEVTNNFCVPSGLSISAYGGGIAITAAAGKLTLNSGTVSKNGATICGGIYSLGDVIMNGGLVSENSSRSLDCGGIYIGPNRAFTMNGGTISKNEGGFGGGILLDFGVHFILNDGLIESNKGGSGGGICSFENTVVEIKGGVIRDNYSGRAGGGILGEMYATAGNVPAQITISGGVISGNSAVSDGGGVNGIITISGGVISGNSAGSYGGGVYGTLTLSDGEISGNKAVTGGGVLGTITMTGGKIINNTATTTAGNTYCYGGGLFGGGIISGGEISGNQVLISSVVTGGGGVYVSGTLTLQTGAVVKDNYSSGRGGGIYLDGSTLNIEGGDITHNEAVSEGAGVYIVGGGSSFTMTDGEISGNKGWSGIYTRADYNAKPSLNISGGIIKDNDVDGITIDISGGDLIMTGGTISGHRRYGIAFIGAGAIQLDGGEISGNSGGGMYASSSECSIAMTGGVIKNNGGGISTQGPLTMTGGEISGNTAYEYGGGVYVSGSTSSFTFTGGVIKNNYAPKSGGGVYAVSAAALMQGGEISGNSAGEKGGGIFVNTSYAGSFTKAPAEGANASGIIFGSNAETALRNSAPAGAALYWDDQSRSYSATIGTADIMLLSKTGDGGYAWE
jgi:hypothetical protein